MTVSELCIILDVTEFKIQQYGIKLFLFFHKLLILVNVQKPCTMYKYNVEILLTYHILILNILLVIRLSYLISKMLLEV